MYPVSYTYIEFLDKTYGMKKTCQLVKDLDYINTFGKSEKDIYEEWLKFLNKNYL